MLAGLQNLLVAKGTTGAGNPLNLSPEYCGLPLGVEVFGTFTGTVILEGTIASQAEVNAATAVWLPITGASWTAQTLASITAPYTHIRANVTAITGGAVNVRAL